MYRSFSGGDGWFTVNPDTGEVLIVGRHQFEYDKVYKLAISAQSVGANPRQAATPTQQLTVKVGVSTPQFYEFEYLVSMPETTPVNGL